MNIVCSTEALPTTARVSVTLLMLLTVLLAVALFVVLRWIFSWIWPPRKNGRSSWSPMTPGWPHGVTANFILKMVVWSIDRTRFHRSVSSFSKALP